MDTNSAYLIGVIFGALCVGLITGGIVLAAGIVKNKIGLGIGGFFACLICGCMLGLILAIPCCVIFMYLILKKAPDTKNTDETPKE